MPVFARMRGDILELTVDGDYTPAELRRVAVRAFDEADVARIPLLIDLSGAAGLRNRTGAERAENRDFLEEHHSRIPRVAVLVPSDVAYGLIRMSAIHHGGSGVTIEPFRTAADARIWLTAEEG